MCDLLDEHPDVVFDYFNCRQCGYQPGEPSPEQLRRYPSGEAEVITAGRVYPGGRAYFDHGPVCGGPVG